MSPPSITKALETLCFQGFDILAGYAEFLTVYSQVNLDFIIPADPDGTHNPRQNHFFHLHIASRDTTGGLLRFGATISNGIGTDVLAATNIPATTVYLAVLPALIKQTIFTVAIFFMVLELLINPV